MAKNPVLSSLNGMICILAEKRGFCTGVLEAAPTLAKPTCAGLCLGQVVGKGRLWLYSCGLNR
jgi:hypothetical protein